MLSIHANLRKVNSADFAVTEFSKVRRIHRRGLSFTPVKGEKEGEISYETRRLADALFPPQSNAVASSEACIPSSSPYSTERYFAFREERRKPPLSVACRQNTRVRRGIGLVGGCL
jgi:hypothetical protein